MLINNHLPECDLVSKILVQRIRVGVIKFVPTSQHLDVHFCATKWGESLCVHRPDI